VRRKERYNLSRQIKFAIVGSIVALTLGCTTNASPSAPASAPGQEPYTPTKLEWLQVEAQTELSENTRCYTVNITKRAPDTIVVVVAYKRCLSEGGAHTVAQQDAGAVRLLAEGHGWKSWVKVESDVHLLNADGRE
jgi:hypothetical protein